MVSNKAIWKWVAILFTSVSQIFFHLYSLNNFLTDRWKKKILYKKSHWWIKRKTPKLVTFQHRRTWFFSSHNEWFYPQRSYLPGLFIRTQAHYKPQDPSQKLLRKWVSFYVESGTFWYSLSLQELDKTQTVVWSCPMLTFPHWQCLIAFTRPYFTTYYQFPTDSTAISMANLQTCYVLQYH